MTPIMRSILFDDHGDIWDAGSRRLADDLHASIHGEELVEFAIRNLGFVAAKDARGSLRISLRPAVVSPIAFSALLYWLHDRIVDRVLISFFDRVWSHEMLPSRTEAVRRLLAKVDFGVGNRDNDFLHQDLPLDTLPDANPLKAVLGVWSATQGIFDEDQIAPVVRAKLNNRYVLVEATPTRAAMVAATCDCVAWAFARTPSAGTPGPITAIQIRSAAPTSRPWLVQSFACSPRPWSVVRISAVRLAYSGSDCAVSQS